MKSKCNNGYNLHHKNVLLLKHQLYLLLVPSPTINHSSPMMRRFLPFLLINTIQKTVIPPGFMKIDNWKWLKHSCNCHDLQHSNVVQHIIIQCIHDRHCRLKTCQYMMNSIQDAIPSSTQWFHDIVSQSPSSSISSSSLSANVLVSSSMTLHNLISKMFDRFGY